MNLFKTSLLAATMLTTGFVYVNAQTADEIMDKHEKAIGGLDNWNKIKTLKASGSMSQQGMEIAIVQTIESGKGLRMDINAMGMSGFQIVTTNDGWSYMPFMGSAKVDTMKPEMVKGQQKQLDLKSHQLLDYKTNGSKLEYVGKDTINNSACYKVKITDKEGNESTNFIDCSTYYLMRTETKVKHDDEETEVAVVYGNYKKMDEGVVMAMSIIPQGQEITWKTIEINKPIDKNTFKPIIEKTEAKEIKK